MPALWPNGRSTPGDVWHEFGPRAPIWTPNGPTSSFHSGIDIGPWGGKGGTWLLAPVSGAVIHAAYDEIFGNRIVIYDEIDGNEIEFWLCHGRTGSMRVKRGDRVSQKQQLQLMGETGKASGVHVHFEVHVNGTRVDPRAFYRSALAAGSNAAPITPVVGEEEDEDMPKNTTQWYKKKNENTYVYIGYNTGSGFFHAFGQGPGGGSMPGDYTKDFMDTFGSEGWSEITESHARVIQQACAAILPKPPVSEIAVTLVDTDA